MVNNDKIEDISEMSNVRNTGNPEITDIILKTRLKYLLEATAKKYSKIHLKNCTILKFKETQTEIDQNSRNGTI